MLPLLELEANHCHLRLVEGDKQRDTKLEELNSIWAEPTSSSWRMKTTNGSTESGHDRQTKKRWGPKSNNPQTREYNIKGFFKKPIIAKH